MLLQSYDRDTLTSIDAETLICPFLTTGNPFALTVQRQTLEWLEYLDVQVEEQTFHHISEVGWLVAYTYPNSPLEGLQLAADWTTLFFLLDDLVEVSISHASIVARNRGILAALGEGAAVPDQALFVALRDVGQRARALGGESWMAVFTHEVARWLDSHLWEQGNRDAKRVPALDDYFAMRQFTIGMYFEFLLSEITDSYHLSAEQRLSPEVATLARTASNEIAWTNDILTLEKEIAQGDVHNVVLSIMQSRDLLLDPALAEAIDMHNREVDAFVLLAHTLRNTRSTSSAVKSLIKALENWMGGHTRWARESKRYGGSRPPSPRRSGIMSI